MSPYSPFSYTSSLIVYLSSCSPFFFHISQCSPFPSQYILALLFSLLSHCSLNIISFYFLYFSYPLSNFCITLPHPFLFFSPHSFLSFRKLISTNYLTSISFPFPSLLSTLSHLLGRQVYTTSPARRWAETLTHRLSD